MPEPVDVYSDQFQLNLGPFGCLLNFSATDPQPPPPGAPPQTHRLATVRMSNEHLKVLTYILHRQVIEYERNTGIRVAIPMQVINGLRIGPEDWETFWAHGDRP
jgi:hypothetical protein